MTLLCKTEKKDSGSKAGSSLRAHAVRGAMWYGGSRLVIQALMWMMTLLVARLLVKEDYGLFGMALVYTAFVDMLNELGFGATIVQKKELHEEDLHTLFWFGLATGLFFFGATYLLAPLVAAMFHQSALVDILRVLGINFIVTSLGMVPWNLLTREIDFKKRSMAEVCGNVAGAACTLLLAFRGWGVWALVFGTLVRNSMITVQVYWQTGWRPKLDFKWHFLRSILNFSTHVMGSRLAWMMNEDSAPFIIGLTLGPSALGIYSLACRFTIDLSGRVLATINQVALPFYSRQQDEVEQLKGNYLKTVQFLCTLNLAVLMGMMLVADDLIPLVLTSKWIDAVPVIQLLCPAAVLLTINAPQSVVWIACGRATTSIRFNLLCLVVMPASFYLGSRFGVLGTCSGWLIGFPILVGIGVNITRRMLLFRWSDYLGAIKPSVLAACAMLTTGYLVKSLLLRPFSPLVHLVIMIPLGAVVYVGVIALVSPETVRQVMSIWRSVAVRKPVQTACAVL